MCRCFPHPFFTHYGFVWLLRWLPCIFKFVSSPPTFLHTPFPSQAYIPLLELFPLHHLSTTVDLLFATTAHATSTIADYYHPTTTTTPPYHNPHHTYTQYPLHQKHTHNIISIIAFLVIQPRLASFLGHSCLQFLTSLRFCVLQAIKSRGGNGLEMRLA